MNKHREPIFINWLPFYTLLQKEIRRFLRVASQTLVTPVITASLYLFIFGATLGERISVLEGFSYAQFVIPGLILMGVINNSFSNVASSLFMSRYLGNIVDLLVTPITPAPRVPTPKPVSSACPPEMVKPSSVADAPKAQITLRALSDR